MNGFQNQESVLSGFEIQTPFLCLIRATLTGPLLKPQQLNMSVQAKNITLAGPLLQTSYLVGHSYLSPRPYSCWPNRTATILHRVSQPQRMLPLSLFPCMCMTPYGNRLDVLIMSLSKGRRKKTMTSGSLLSFSLEQVWGPKFMC